MQQNSGKQKMSSGSRINLLLLIVVIILIGIGIVMLFSASFYYGQTREGDGYFYVKGQLIKGVLLGFIAMIALYFFDYHFYKKMYKLVYLGCLFLLVLVFIPGIGRGDIYGASRWINLPLVGSFQPSEVAKYGLVVVAAALIDKCGTKGMHNFLEVIKICLTIGIIIIAIYIQPNFSMCVITGLTLVVMLVIGGMRKGQFALLAAMGVGVGVPMMISESYRLMRLTIFRDPWSRATQEIWDKGYQLRQSLYAIGAGGLFGTGLGQSRQKFLFLPMGESDFIFSIVAEELGLFNCILIIMIYLLLIGIGFAIAYRAKDAYGRLLAAGITTILGLQAFINMAVALSAMPTTGVPLPFMSYGSSAMLTSLAAVGILLNISKQSLPKIKRPMN